MAKSMAKSNNNGGYSSTAEALAAAIVESGDLATGASLVLGERRRAVKAARPSVAITIRIPESEKRAPSSGTRYGDQLVELHVQGDALDVAAKLRDLASVFSGMSSELVSANILVLTSMRQPSDEELA